MKHKFTHRVSKVTAEQLEGYHRFPNTVSAAFAGGKLQDSQKEVEVMSMRSFAKIWQTVKKVEPCLDDSPDKLEKEFTHANSLSYPYCIPKIWDVPKCDTDLYDVL